MPMPAGLMFSLWHNTQEEDLNLRDVPNSWIVFSDKEVKADAKNQGVL